MNHAGALSLIALAATHGQLYKTDLVCGGGVTTHGIVRDGVEPGPAVCGEATVGSSFAAPVVTGAASLLHYWLTAQGHPTIDSPGRLFAAMLAMGDSHYEIQGQSTTVQRTTGSDVRYGLGRLKARKPASWKQATVTFTSSSAPYSTWIDPSPMPAGTSIVKCVAQQSEDMSSKTTVSDVDLGIELYTPVNGACAVSGLAQTRTDDSYDVKSMVAYRSPTTLAGKCARARLTWDQIAGASVSTHLFCYHATEDDDEPH